MFSRCKAFNSCHGIPNIVLGILKKVVKLSLNFEKYPSILEFVKEFYSIVNTQFMTNLTIVYMVKMEYGWNFSISGLKMMVKSGPEEIFLKFLHAKAIF